VSLVVEQVSKRYRGTTGPVDALRSVSLRAEPGDMVSIVGPNGAGKTTLLQVVAGVLTPTAGRVCRPRSTSSLLEVGSAYDPDLSGRENLQAGLAFDRVRSRDRAGSIAEIAEFAGLTESLDLPVKHYSDGMVARLSASQAVHRDVRLLVMDEAMSVGDASFERRLLRRVDEMRSTGTIVVVATHSLALARSAPRCIWLRNGSVVRDGPAATVLQDYELSAGVGRPVSDDPRARFLDIAAVPAAVEPGRPLELSVGIEVLRASEDLSLRVEARPVVGDELWMRPRDPSAAPADVLVAVAPSRPLGGLRTGTVRATGTIPSVRITATELEVTVVLVDAEGRIHDEISCPVTVSGRVGRPGYLLRTEVLHRG